MYVFLFINIIQTEHFKLFITASKYIPHLVNMKSSTQEKCELQFREIKKLQAKDHILFMF